jgi:hypothetical protein
VVAAGERRSFAVVVAGLEKEDHPWRDFGKKTPNSG